MEREDGVRYGRDVEKQVVLRVCECRKSGEEVCRAGFRAGDESQVEFREWLPVAHQTVADAGDDDCGEAERGWRALVRGVAVAAPRSHRIPTSFYEYHTWLAQVCTCARVHVCTRTHV